MPSLGVHILSKQWGREFGLLWEDLGGQYPFCQCVSSSNHTRWAGLPASQCLAMESISGVQGSVQGLGWLVLHLLLA